MLGVGFEAAGCGVNDEWNVVVFADPHDVHLSLTAPACMFETVLIGNLGELDEKIVPQSQQFVHCSFECHMCLQGNLVNYVTSYGQGCPNDAVPSRRTTI